MQQIYDPRISVLFRESLKDLSPSLVLMAEVDLLNDEILLYYKRLQREGVPSDLKLYKGTYHGFFRFVLHDLCLNGPAIFSRKTFECWLSCLPNEQVEITTWYVLS